MVGANDNANPGVAIIPAQVFWTASFPVASGAPIDTSSLGVHAFKVRTGEKMWSYFFGTAAVNCAPVVDGNLVFIGHGEETPEGTKLGRVVCLDASKIKDGQPEVRLLPGQRHHCGIAILSCPAGATRRVHQFPKTSR